MKHLPGSFPSAKVNVAESPQSGSILQGARILFGLSEFDTSLCVTKKEYEVDQSSVIKKLF
jgi:hypothetical protein